MPISVLIVECNKLLLLTDEKQETWNQMLILFPFKSNTYFFFLRELFNFLFRIWVVVNTTILIKANQTDKEIRFVQESLTLIRIVLCNWLNPQIKNFTFKRKNQKSIFEISEDFLLQEVEGLRSSPIFPCNWTNPRTFVAVPTATGLHSLYLWKQYKAAIFIFGTC